MPWVQSFLKKELVGEIEMVKWIRRDGGEASKAEERKIALLYSPCPPRKCLNSILLPDQCLGSLPSQESIK
jgi:hypothetical protein